MQQTSLHAKPHLFYMTNSMHTKQVYTTIIFTIDIRKRDGLATLLLSIFYLQLSTPEANIAQLVW